jgi:hypothetical protein
MHPVFKHAPKEALEKALAFMRTHEPIKDFNLWFIGPDSEIHCPLGLVNREIVEGKGHYAHLPLWSEAVYWEVDDADSWDFTLKVDTEKIATVEELAEQMGLS